jgi:hypothetical protein
MLKKPLIFSYQPFFILILIIYCLSTTTFLLKAEESLPPNYLYNIQELEKQIYSRGQSWQWHEEQINEHRYHQQMLNQLNEQDRKYCQELAQVVLGFTYECAPYNPNGYWLLKDDQAEWKTERIKFVQDYAEEVGLGAFKLELVAQLHTENGSWDETRTGDSGCSIGLSQINLCARTALRENENLNNWQWQIKAFVDEIKANYLKYKNFERAQVGWNNPQAMVINQYKTSYYYKIRETKSLFEFVEKLKE